MKEAETKLWENGKDEGRKEGGGPQVGERWQPEDVSEGGGSVAPEGQMRRREGISGGGNRGQLRGGCEGLRM